MQNHHHRRIVIVIVIFIITIFASTYQKLFYDAYHVPDNAKVNDHKQTVANKNNLKYKIWLGQEAIFLKNIKRINEYNNRKLTVGTYKSQ